MNPEQTRAVVGAVTAIADAIKELGTVPSGVLYAHAGQVLSLDQYQAIIGFLQKEKFIKVEAHLITWIGGQP